MEQEKKNISVSIVIPLYNKEKYIRKTLLSVLNQSCRNFEIVVVDDGSTDNSIEVVRSFNDSRIRIIFQENQGVSAARNRGIAEAKYELIAFLDADDEWKPEYLQTQCDLFCKYPECSVFACNYIFRDATGKISPTIIRKLPFNGMDGILTNYFEVASCSHPPLCTSAIVVEKKAVLSVGGFNTKIGHGEDILTWAKLAAKYAIAYSGNPVSIYNLADNSGYNSVPVNIPQGDIVGKELVSMLKIITPGYKKDFKKYIGHWYKIRASLFLRGNESKNFMICYFKSLKYNPLNYRIWGYIFFIFIPNSYRNKIFKCITSIINKK